MGRSRGGLTIKVHALVEGRAYCCVSSS